MSPSDGSAGGSVASRMVTARSARTPASESTPATDPLLAVGPTPAGGVAVETASDTSGPGRRSSALPPPPQPPGPPTPRPGWRSPALLGLGALGGTALVALLNPTDNHIPLCPLQALTGLDCSFCGGLRAVHALTRGDVGVALDHNVLLVAALPLVVVGWAFWLVRGIRSPERPAPSPPPAVQIALWVVVLGFGVVRNLPMWDWLASGA